MPINLVVLISGSGSNLQAIIDAIESGRLNARISAVISNRVDAFGLERAKLHDIKTICIEHKNFTSRELFDQALQQEIASLTTDFIVMAGFMRILSAGFIKSFEHRMLNIHPSLLPKYQGLHTHQRALDNRDTEHGVSVHLVTEKLDDGPVLIQGKMNISTEDTVDTLASKAHLIEHQVYSQVLIWLAEKRLQIKNGIPFFDQKRLNEPLQY